jgi:hypothetical protein
MKHLLTFLLFALPAFGQVQINTSATIQNAAVSPFRAFILAQFPAADTNADGAISNAEALAWLSNVKIQRDLVEFYVVQAVLRAETEDPTTLQQAHQDALTALAAAQANVQAQRELLCPRCAWPNQ